MSSVSNSVLLQLFVNAGLFKKPTAEGIRLPHETDSVQPRGQSTSNLQPTSKTTPTLLTKTGIKFNVFFQIEMYKVILLCIIFKKFPVKQIFCLNLT